LAGRDVFCSLECNHELVLLGFFTPLDGMYFVLKSVIRGPARGWNCETLINIMKACIIMYNMIIENERNTDDVNKFEYEQITEIPQVHISRNRTIGFMEFI
jgi:hypothetical protein